MTADNGDDLFDDEETGDPDDNRKLPAKPAPRPASTQTPPPPGVSNARISATWSAVSMTIFVVVINGRPRIVGPRRHD
jgi:hypothetical protein